MTALDREKIGRARDDNCRASQDLIYTIQNGGGEELVDAFTGGKSTNGKQVQGKKTEGEDR